MQAFFLIFLLFLFCSKKSPFIVFFAIFYTVQLLLKSAELLLSQSGPTGLGPALCTLRWAPGSRTTHSKKKSPPFGGDFSREYNYSSMSITTPEPTVQPLPRKLRFRGNPLNLNAQGGKAALPPRFCPSNKTLVRVFRRAPSSSQSPLNSVSA